MPDDTYLSIAAIARDPTMIDRVSACVIQQHHLGNFSLDIKWGEGESGVLSWVSNHAFMWAASPGWAAAWDYALNVNSGNADYNPARDPGCITDGMILAAIQALGGPPAAPAPGPQEAPPEEMLTPTTASVDPEPDHPDSHAHKGGGA